MSVVFFFVTPVVLCGCDRRAQEAWDIRRRTNVENKSAAHAIPVAVCFLFIDWAFNFHVSTHVSTALVLI